EIGATEYYEFSLFERPPQVGEDTLALGYPGYGPGDRLNIRAGTISSFPTKQGVNKIEVVQQLTPGMSGGPLLDADGNVLGIIHRGGPEQGNQLAVHACELAAWIAEP